MYAFLTFDSGVRTLHKKRKKALIKAHQHHFTVKSGRETNKSQLATKIAPVGGTRPPFYRPDMKDAVSYKQ